MSRIVLIQVSIGPTSTSLTNSNKFHEFTETGPDQWTHRYGRVGAAGQTSAGLLSKHEVDKKVRTKTNEGYRKVDTVDSANVSADVKEVAKRDILGGNKNPVLEEVISFISEQNRHHILSKTNLSYADTTGLFSTPLGVVTKDTIVKARSTLDLIERVMGGKGNQNPDELSVNFMMLIPQNIGRDRPTLQRVCPDVKTLDAHRGICDALEASIDMAQQRSLNPSVPAEKRFRIHFDVVHSAEMKRVNKVFLSTHQPMHTSSRMKLNKVFDMRIEPQHGAFEEDGAKVGNIQELWHGTSIANILSIMANGLMIPKSCSHGRMFGHGMYFSDQSTKSLNYASGHHSGSNHSRCFMFLAEVALGKTYIPTSNNGIQDIQAPIQGYDSTFGKKGSTQGLMNNEMIVYRTTQARIVRLCEFID